MELYIIRHAWAEDRDEEQWADDALRPLTCKGQERFADMVKKLVKREFAPEIIATSSMVRCRQTADLIAERVKGKPEVVELQELLPDSNLDGLLAWTAQQVEGHEAIAWVGHAPDVGRLAAALIGTGDVWIDFAKGAVAAIRFETELKRGGGELRWLVTAKLLGC
jgi:phosphohistidine phosphatase